ncbi:DUF3408 domain-containing protein [Bacteroides fragilis]|jgi:hypothetical protein|uniref:DUF3408 domain-containing protein n=1 Tax=Bacteroides fragilis TaxID=817 RepID=UPI00051718F1|nr:DUF3408 domain-containing protein [Bacteroides fragilis]
MAKKLKEDVNLDEIDENFIISSFKTTGKQAPEATAKGNDAEKVREKATEKVAETTGTVADAVEVVERAKENRETGKGKKRGLSEYGEKFLKRNELKTRQCVYISGQIHAVISRLVHVIADKDITVGGYIDTVLAEHLERHKEEINELYRQKREDLI